jgi:hypothetical protein
LRFGSRSKAIEVDGVAERAVAAAAGGFAQDAELLEDAESKGAFTSVSDKSRFPYDRCRRARYAARSTRSTEPRRTCGSSPRRLEPASAGPDSRIAPHARIQLRPHRIRRIVSASLRWRDRVAKPALHMHSRRLPNREIRCAFAICRWPRPSSSSRW